MTTHAPDRWSVEHAAYPLRKPHKPRSMWALAQSDSCHSNLARNFGESQTRRDYTPHRSLAPDTPYCSAHGIDVRICVPGLLERAPHPFAVSKYQSRASIGVGTLTGKPAVADPPIFSAVHHLYSVAVTTTCWLMVVVITNIPMLTTHGSRKQY